MKRRKELELLAARIRAARQAAKLSRQKLADAVGMGHQAIYYYENAINEPPKDILKRIAEITGVSVSYLLGETDDSRPLSEWRLSEIGQTEYLAGSKPPEEGNIKQELNRSLRDKGD